MNQDELPAPWRTLLGEAWRAPAMAALGDFLAAEEQAGTRVFPPRGERLRALALTPPERVKAVILGQDPYHRPGQAHGLAFSVPPGVAPPPSLRNIFRAIAADLGSGLPPHGCLEAWAQRGVLLLNSALSVAEGRPGSHRGRGWEGFTDTVLRAVAAARPTAFLLWGGPAQARAAGIAELAAPRHLVLAAPHPSPLSAWRGFLDCRHFSQVNAWLAAQGREPIDWDLTQPRVTAAAQAGQNRRAVASIGG